MEMAIGRGSGWLRFEAGILREMIEEGRFTESLYEKDGDTYYTIKKKEVNKFIKHLEEERERQWQQGLFRDRKTIAYKEISFLLRMLKRNVMYKYHKEEDVVEVFRVLAVPDLIGDLEEDIKRIQEEMERERDEKRNNVIVLYT